MDESLRIGDPVRRVAPEVSAATPLVTLAWRALRAEHQRRAVDRARLDDELQACRAALASLAEGTYRLRRALHDHHLAALAESMEEALAAAGVTILAPEGECYTPERMEVLDNVGQLPAPGGSPPRIVEVIAPAILYRGALLRSGKAVISVPSGSGEVGPEAPEAVV